jgi:hypothetical protein
VGIEALLWTATASSTSGAYNAEISSDAYDLYLGQDNNNQANGMYVRCLKNNVTRYNGEVNSCNANSLLRSIMI